MKKKGSALVLMIAIVSLLLILSVSAATSASSTFKTAYAFDYMSKVNLAAESGIDKGIVQLGMKSGDSHLSNYFVGDALPVITMPDLPFDNNISCTVSFSSTDLSSITITSYARTADNKYKKTLTKTVSKDNRPNANLDNVTVPLNIPTHINVLANDLDVDNDSIKVISITSPSHGTATLNLDGSDVIYTGTTAGTDTFNYQIKDGYGGVSTGTVNITVTSGNHSPVANADSVNVNLGSTTNINVLGNDTDADNDYLTVSRIITQPQKGIINSFGSNVTYTANSVGTDNFTYEASDGHGGTSSATVTVNITAQQPTITSYLFNTKRKFMVGNVVTSTANDSLTFNVKPGNSHILASDENFLFLSPIQNSTSFSSGYSFSKGNNSHGVKVTSDNFFSIASSSNNVIPMLNSSGPFDTWVAYGGRYYFKTNSDLVIDPSSSSRFMQGLKSYSSFPKIIMVNGNVTILKANAQFSGSYLNQLLIYCTGGTGKGTLNLNNSVLGSYQNKNKINDIDFCYIANTLNLIGSNTASYIGGNTTLPSVSNDPIIRSILTNNIQSSIDWQ